MKALFLVNGLGLGNSTRCHAVMQRLAEEGDVEIAVVTSGNGAWYLADRPEVSALHELEPFWYAKRDDGTLSVAGTLGAAGAFLGIARRNDALIAEVIARFQPDVAVIDSTYTICSVKRAGVPIVALNNADVVHAAYRTLPDPPASTRSQFRWIEENDRRFHAFAADVVASPSLDPDLLQLGAPFERIGPIVRRGYLPRPARPTPERVVVMLSGSAFGAQVRFEQPLPGVRVDVIGRERPDDVPALDDVHWHGKVRDNRDLLHEADLLVVNGGFSAVSEAFCMRKPMLVIPVPNHAEQWVNAATIRHLGVGDLADETDLEARIEVALGRVPAWRDAYAALPDPADGAAQAAALLRRVASEA